MAAAEQRLTRDGLRQVQIEYEYTCGDADSERLLAWYEGALGFSAGSKPTTSRGRTEFRRLRKRLGKAPSVASTSPTSTDGSGSERAVIDGAQETSCRGALRRLYRVVCGD